MMSDNTFLSLAEDSDRIMFSMAQNGKLIWFNKAFEIAVKCDSINLMDLSIFELIAEKNAPKLVEAIQNSLENLAPLRINFSLKTEFQTYRSFKWLAKFARDKDYFLFEGTPSVQENEHKGFTSQHYKSWFENSKSLICLHDLDGNLIKVNQAAAISLGFEKSQLTKMSLFDLVIPNNHHLLKKYLTNIRYSREDSGEMELMNKQGDIRVWMYNNTYTAEGLVLGNAFDITDQYEKRKTLNFKKEILDHTGMVAKVGGWYVDLETQEVYWTPMTKIIHEVSHDFIPDLNTGINFYKEGESRIKITETVQEALQSGQSFDLELQIVTAKGAEKWVRTMGSPKLENGICKRLFGTFQDIDAQKKSSIELAKAKKELDDVLNSASEISIIATDLNGLITLFNRGAERMLGYTSEEMVGNKSAAVLHNVVEIEEREKEISEQLGYEVRGFGVFTEISRLNDSEKRDWTYIRKDGSALRVSLVVTPVRDLDGKITGYLGVATDVTVARSLEMELFNERSRLKAFVTHAPAAVAMLDRDMNYLAVSNRWIEDYNINERQIAGVSHYKIFPNLDNERLERHKNVLNGLTMKREEDVYIVPGTGVHQYISWEMRPWYGKDNQIGGMMIFTRDVTAMVKFREELKIAKLRAEAANVAKSEFLANMSHEIRTPLNGVIGFSDLILKTKLEETQHHYLSIVNQSANSLLNIINDILDFSKIEAGKLELDETKFDIFEIAAQSAEIIDFHVKSKGLEMLINIPPDFPRYIWGDSIRLKQIFVNLLGNSVKFTKSGEIELKLEVLDSNSTDFNIRFSVRDTGIGIPSDKILKIFEAFSQADNSTTRKYGGTGLGLNISNKLLDMMDSKLHVKSLEGQGSTFYFDLQIQAEYGNETQWENINHVKHVLIVDDNENNRTIVKQMLGLQGIITDEVPDGIDALGLLSKHNKYQAILLDFHMPGLNGIETARKIRELQIDLDENIPIILLHSSAEDSTIRKACEELDIRQRLAKPLRNEQLLNALSKLKVKIGVEHEDENVIYTKTSNESIEVLVVEDDDLNLFLLTTILEDILPKSIIKTAKNGKEAVNQAIIKLPDIIFMDIRMPIMDGFEATREIRKIANAAKIPIIAATAGNAKNEEVESIQAGMNDYLVKPFIEEQVLEIFSKWLNLTFFN